MSADTFLKEKVQALEQLVRGRPDSPDIRRARAALLRVSHCKQRGLLKNAPRLRRHILADLRGATHALERNLYE